MKYWLAAAALVVALLGNIEPVVSILHLWRLPPGSGVRPMGAPISFLFFGCGTAIVVVTFAMFVFRETMDPAEPLRHRMLLRAVAVVSCLIGLVPFFLTTLGVYWVIKAHSLWLKP